MRLAEDLKVGGVSVPIEAVDATEPGLKKAKANVDKSVKDFDASLTKLEKSFSRLAVSVDKSMKDINKSMQGSVTSLDKLSDRLNNRLVAMQRSNTAAIAAQTRSLQQALNGHVDASSKSVDKVGNQMKKHEGYYDSLIGKFRSLAVNIWIATQALESLGSSLLSVFKPGFEFTKEMETTTLGTAGILTSMFKLNGKNLEWNQALGISKKLMSDIADDALVTTATVQELSQIFQSVLAPASNAGWSIDQTREFAKVGANAVKAIGLPAQQVVQELRDLIMGGIRPASSTLAASLGIDDKTVKAWKESGKLFENLMERLQGFNMAAKETQNSFAGLFSNIQDGVQRITSMGFAPVFDALKTIQGLFFDIVPVMAEVNGEMKRIGDRAVFNNKTLSFFYDISQVVLRLWGNIRDIFAKFQPTLLAASGILVQMIEKVEKYFDCIKKREAKFLKSFSQKTLFDAE